MNINKVIEKLNEAQAILGGIPVDPPDMEVAEFNKTPIGRAMRLIYDAQEILTLDEDE